MHWIVHLVPFEMVNVMQLLSVDRILFCIHTLHFNLQGNFDNVFVIYERIYRFQCYKNVKIFIFFLRLGVLAPDGYCRPFDVDATGYTRSEAVCMIFLQRAKDAKRIYSTVLYSKVNCDGKFELWTVFIIWFMIYFSEWERAP